MSGMKRGSGNGKVTECKQMNDGVLHAVTGAEGTSKKEQATIYQEMLVKLSLRTGCLKWMLKESE